jgi:hypothetical protein
MKANGLFQRMQRDAALFVWSPANISPARGSRVRMDDLALLHKSWRLIVYIFEHPVRIA